MVFFAPSVLAFLFAPLREISFCTDQIVETNYDLIVDCLIKTGERVGFIARVAGSNGARRVATGGLV